VEIPRRPGSTTRIEKSDDTVSDVGAQGVDTWHLCVPLDVVEAARAAVSGQDLGEGKARRACHKLLTPPACRPGWAPPCGSADPGRRSR
jgi:hypothetical protein